MSLAITAASATYICASVSASTLTVVDLDIEGCWTPKYSHAEPQINSEKAQHPHCSHLRWGTFVETRLTVATTTTDMSVLQTPLSSNHRPITVYKVTVSSAFSESIPFTSNTLGFSLFYSPFLGCLDLHLQYFFVITYWTTSGAFLHECWALLVAFSQTQTLGEGATVWTPRAEPLLLFWLFGLSL